jgi:hypothetical protein
MRGLLIYLERAFNELHMGHKAERRVAFGILEHFSP